jgi:predicted RNA-binding protein
MFKYEIVLFFEFWGEDIVFVEEENETKAMRKAMNDYPEANGIVKIKCLNQVY